jgi:MoxR-like ATPase
MSSLGAKGLEFVRAAESMFGSEAVLTREQIVEVVENKGTSYPYFLVNKSEYRVGRGTYRLPNIGTKAQIPEEAVAMSAQVLALRQPKLVDESDVSVPAIYPDYVPFGFYVDLKNIVSTRDFYPVFITGLSGNGKTLMVEQVCANLKRECIRVNISIETDETDLLGSYQLVNGNTVYKDGPVLQAMKRGAICLIDEVDRGSNKLMCLQGILEGKPYYNKKTGEMVYPQPGFSIIATANTKGRGSEEGKYLSQILDDAFLERFPITVEQEYPDVKTEKKILSPLIEDKEFVELLIKWADIVRQSYDQDAIDEIISTRRLVHIAKAFKIFKNRMKAIELCVNRFDADTKQAFLDLYAKVDVKVVAPEPTKTVAATSTTEVPF